MVITSMNSADSTTAEGYVLSMGSLGSYVWPSPPPAVRILLQELFIEQPDEDPLTWVHQAVWYLQKQETGTNRPDMFSNATLAGLQARLHLTAGLRENISATMGDRLSNERSLDEDQPDTDEERSHAAAHKDSDAGVASDSDDCKADATSATKEQGVLLTPKAIPTPSTMSQAMSQAMSQVMTPSRLILPHNEVHRRNSRCDSRAESAPPSSAPSRRTSQFSLDERGHSDSFRPRSNSFRLAMPEFTRDDGQCSRRGSTRQSTDSIIRIPTDSSQNTHSDGLNTRTSGTSSVAALQAAAANDVVKVSSARSKGSLAHGGVSGEGFAKGDNVARHTGRQVSVLPNPQDQLRYSMGSIISPDRGSMRASTSMYSTWITDFMGSDRAPRHSRNSTMGDNCVAAYNSETNPLSKRDRWTCVSLCSPMSWQWIIWEFIYLLCILHELWAVPFGLVFLSDHEFPEGSHSVPVAIAVLACFCIDLVLHFIEELIDRGPLFVETLKQFTPHSRSSLLLDCSLTLFDFYLLASDRDVRLLTLVKLGRGWRLLRAWRSMEMCIALYAHKGHRQLLAYILQLNIVVIILSHIHGVIWAALQPVEWMPGTTAEAFDRYLESFWQACLAMTLGGAVPTSTQGQQVLGIIASLERAAIYGVATFLFVECVVKHNGTSGQEARLAGFVVAYLRDHGAPPLAQLNVLMKFQEAHKARNLQLCFDFCSGQQLPVQIRVTLADVFWRSKLMSLGLVRDLMNHHSQFARELTNSSQAEFAPTFTVLYHHDETCHDAYHILAGALEVSYVEDETEPQEPYASGMWVGEKALVNHELRRGETISSMTFVELMVVSGTDFRRLLRRFSLTTVYEDLVKANLWLGFCGRCGSFGDHFKRECPLLKLNQQKQGFLRRVLPRFLRKRVHTTPIGKDLRVFLQTYQLERLLEPLYNVGIRNLADLTPELVRELGNDPTMCLSEDERQVFNYKLDSFRKRHAMGATRILANTGSFENYYIFISHYKEEAGTEAALMHEGLKQMIAKQHHGFPGQDLASPVFLDTEDLTDLASLREHVRKSHNLIVLLTNGVLSRPWVLLEICTALESGVTVLPVEIQRHDVKFQYPDEEYFQAVASGRVLDEGAKKLLTSNEVNLEQLANALRQVFKKIALPFSPQKSASIRKAELRDILKRCEIKQGRASFSNDWPALSTMNVNTYGKTSRATYMRTTVVKSIRNFLSQRAIPEEDYGAQGSEDSRLSVRKGWSNTRTTSAGTPAGAEFASIAGSSR